MKRFFSDGKSENQRTEKTSSKNASRARAFPTKKNVGRIVKFGQDEKQIKIMLKEWKSFDIQQFEILKFRF